MSTSGGEERDPSAEPSSGDGSATPSGAAHPSGAEESAEGGRGQRRWPVKAAAALLIVASLVGVVAGMAGFGSRWGLWDFRTGFILLEWSAYGGLAVFLVALPVLWLSRPGRKLPRAFLPALAALVLSAPVFLVPLGWRLRAGDVPPIHDITTDTNDPPRFDEIVPLRANAPNPVEYPGSDVAEQQRSAYPDLRPAVLDIPVERAYERALAAARELGWQIVAADLEAGRIEATDRTFWFGFTDDIVVRLTPSGDRTIVDVRSKSRVGRSDVGTNARRIRSYLDRLTDETVG